MFRRLCGCHAIAFIKAIGQYPIADACLCALDKAIRQARGRRVECCGPVIASKLSVAALAKAGALVSRRFVFARNQRPLPHCALE